MATRPRQRSLKVAVGLSFNPLTDSIRLYFWSFKDKGLRDFEFEQLPQKPQAGEFAGW